jgi:hypothetical protein
MCLKDAQGAGMRESRRRVTTSTNAAKPTSASSGTSGSSKK